MYHGYLVQNRNHCGRHCVPEKEGTLLMVVGCFVFNKRLSNGFIIGAIKTSFLLINILSALSSTEKRTLKSDDN